MARDSFIQVNPSDIAQPALIVPGPATPQVAPASDPVIAAPSSKADVTRARPPENPRIVSANTSSNSAVAVDAESRDMEQECSNWLGRKSDRERAAREAEAKDPAWAYSMEQLLQQYAATHPQGQAMQEPWSQFGSQTEMSSGGNGIDENLALEFVLSRR